MSDTETIVDDVTTDVETEIDTTDAPAEISYEQALEWKKKADRLEKAEKTLVEYKKKAKELEGKSETPSDIMTKADYAMEKFLDKNPELSEYTKELSEYTKKGLSLEDAKTLVLNSDKAKQNREKTNSLGLSDGEDGAKKDTYTQDELAKMPPEKAQKLWTLASQGKIKVR